MNTVSIQATKYPDNETLNQYQKVSNLFIVSIKKVNIFNEFKNIKLLLYH